MPNVTAIQDRPSSAEKPRPVFLDVPDPSADAVHAARHEFRALLDKAAVHPDAADAAELVFSEIVTNALEHGRRGAKIGIAVTVTATTIAMAVTDMPRRARRPAYADPELHGRGMLLIRALATITETKGPGWRTTTAVIQIGEPA